MINPLFKWWNKKFVAMHHCMQDFVVVQQLFAALQQNSKNH
jgi:hypothetical protein